MCPPGGGGGVPGVGVPGEAGVGEAPASPLERPPAPLNMLLARLHAINAKEMIPMIMMSGGFAGVDDLIQICQMGIVRNEGCIVRPSAR